MNIQILSAITKGIWAMHPDIAESYYPVLHTIFSGHSIDFKENVPAPSFISMTSGIPVNEMSTASQSTEGKYVAILPIKSVILKYDQSCGPRGTETLASMIRSYADDPRIAGIVLDIDSPGGEGRAINNMVAAIDGIEKPVLTHISSGMCASAAYGIASHTNEIYCSYATDVVGSIGTYITLMDFYKYYEKQGLPVHTVYATKSTEKNLSFKEALQGNYTKLKAEIDQYNEAFISLVKEGRGDKIKEEVFNGQAPFADTALSLGLIDGIQSFQDTVNRVFELAEARDKKTSAVSQSIQQTQTSDMNFEKLSAALAGISTSGGSIELTAEQVSAIQAEIAASTSEGNVLTTEELQAIRNEVPEATQQQITQLQARVNELEEEPDPNGTGIIPGAGAEGSGGSNDNDFLTDDEKAIHELVNRIAP
jgi:protease IV